MVFSDLSKSILEQLGYSQAEPVTEAKKKDEPKVEPATEPTVESVEHVCPLCESKLSAPLEESKVESFVTSLMDLSEDEDVEGDEVVEGKKKLGLKGISNEIKKGDLPGKKK